MKQFQFQIHISSSQYLDYYRGTVRYVHVQCADGTSVQFPAALLQPYVTLDGIHGDFVLLCDDQHKGAALQRLRN